MCNKEVGFACLWSGKYISERFARFFSVSIVAKKPQSAKQQLVQSEWWKRQNGFGLLRYIVGALCLLTLVSCKIRVVVPDGGSVTTASGTFSCPSGKTCDIDVLDFYFDETFKASAEEGYTFTSWRKGDRRFCGKDPKPCHLFTTAFTGDWVSAVLPFLESNEEVFYLQPIFKPAGDIVSANGKEWLQPDLFGGLTWDEINAVCPEGKCAGVLKGFDITGWTWASVDDVNALFNYYIGKRKLGPGGSRYEEADSVWAPAFFNTGWRANLDFDEEYHRVYGWTRTISVIDKWGTYAYDPGIADCLSTCPTSGYPPGTDTARTIHDGLTLDYSLGGAWFYRKPKN
jgi:hypothetical protein